MRVSTIRAGLFARLLILAVGFAGAAHAEQMQRFDPWEVHYVLVPTSFLKPDIAARHGIVRGRDRAFLNLSVLGEDGQPVPAEVAGIMRNLLGQQERLAFDEIREGEAIYYIATLKHTDRDVLRFTIDIVPPDGRTRQLSFQQRMYWDGR